MIRTRALKILTAMGMLILLTSARAFGQEPKLQRQAYVIAAYEQFTSLIYILSLNDRFLNGLTPQERAQFVLLGNQLIEHKLIFGPAPQPGDYNTSKQGDIRLHFSDNSADFILNPGEPERTAKMDGDIWFNLNVLNKPQVPFGLLDAFQILFHEFGHSLGDKKDQAAIDSIAAKVRTEVSSFYKETVLGPKTKVSSVLLPFVLSDRHMLDHQFEPVVILDHHGKAAQAKIDIQDMQMTGVGFIEVTGRSQAYARYALTPKFSVEESGIRVEWNIAIRHSLVLKDRFNFGNLFFNLEKAQADEALPAFTENMRLVQQVTTEQLADIQQGSHSTQAFSPKGLNIEYLTYRLANFESRWLQPLRQDTSVQDKLLFTAVVQTKEALHSVLMQAQRESRFFGYRGRVVPLGLDVYRIEFSLPKTSSIQQEMKISSIVLNDKDQWDLETAVKVQLNKTTEPRRVSPSMIGVVNNGKVQLVTDMDNSAIPTTGLIQWTFTYNDPSTRIEQVEFLWLITEEVYQGQTRVALRNRPLYEVVARNQLKQFETAGSWSVTVPAVRASALIPIEKRPDGLEVRDTGMRSMISFQISDDRYNAFLAKGKLVPTWNSIFQVTPQAETCAEVFK